MVDVLSFVDADLVHFRGSRSRQIAIDGVPLVDIVNSALGHDAAQSTPLVDRVVDFDMQRVFLEGLRGSPTPEALPGSLITLGFCDQCLDNDRWLLASHLEYATALFGGTLSGSFWRTVFQ